MSKELEKMSLAELVLFHSWFFGDDRQYMIDHIMEHSENIKEELARFRSQQKEDGKELKPFCNICGSGQHIKNDACTKCQSIDLGYTD